MDHHVLTKEDDLAVAHVLPFRLGLHCLPERHERKNNQSVYLYSEECRRLGEVLLKGSNDLSFLLFSNCETNFLFPFQ